MKKVLVLGGTRFFGKRLVEQLIGEQADITIVTRGNSPDTFGSAVKHLKADRTDSAALRQVLGSQTFDMVYDNICFTPHEAEAVVQLFDGRVGKYIVTSSLSIYPFGEAPKSEGDFDPYSYPIPHVLPATLDYAEGKRLTEAVIFQKASFPAAAVRFPIVLGHDDYTRRLHFHIEHVQQGLPLGVPNPNANMSYIRSDEAASFLAWLGHSTLEGPVNACSSGVMSPGQVISLIEQATGKRADMHTETEDEHMSPFGIPEPWYMNTSKAEEAGFVFQKLNVWLPNLIREIASGKTV